MPMLNRIWNVAGSFVSTIVDACLARLYRREVKSDIRPPLLLPPPATPSSDEPPKIDTDMPHVPLSPTLVAMDFGGREERLGEERKTSEEFNFKGAVLDQLDRSFKILKRLKRRNPDTYDLYSKHGAAMGSNESLHTKAELLSLSPWWLKTRPAFGAFFFGDVPEKGTFDGDTIHIHFACFTKYAPAGAPPDVQRVKDGDVYILTCIFDDLRQAERKAIISEIPLRIDAVGNITALRMIIENRNSIRCTKASGRGGKRTKRGEYFTVPSRNWKVPAWHEATTGEKFASADDYIRYLFCLVANVLEWSQSSMTKIRAWKGGACVAFSVNIERTPYFFRDRNVTVTVDGKKRRIFHIVRTHTRALANGRVRPVRTHFRGERKFWWNGYRIEISVPGWHGLDVSDFAIGMLDSESDKARKAAGDMLPMSDMAERLLAAERGQTTQFKKARPQAEAQHQNAA